jgi:hypothetical protein
MENIITEEEFNLELEHARRIILDSSKGKVVFLPWQIIGYADYFAIQQPFLDNNGQPMVYTVTL